MKIRRSCTLLGLSALCGAFLAAEAVAMQQSKPLSRNGAKIKRTKRATARPVAPDRIRYLGPDGQPATDWIAVTPEMIGQNSPLAGAGADCTSTTGVFDGGEFDPLTGLPVGGDECNATGPPLGPQSRLYFGDGYCSPRTVGDFEAEPGTGGAMISRVSVGWEWFVDGFSAEDCFVILAMYEDFDDTCAMSPSGFPADGFLGGVVLGFTALAASPVSVDGYYTVDLNICSDINLGVDAMFRAPSDGEGAIELILASAIPGGIETAVNGTCAQPMLWGTEASRPGANVSSLEYADDNPADGVYSNECYDNAGAGAFCNGSNPFDSNAWCSMISLWTLDAGNTVPPGFDFLQEDTGATSFAEFGGSGFPTLPAGFFDPGSDPFVGTIELDGQPLDPSCSTLDTVILRPEAAIIPMPGGGPGNLSQFIPIEILALDLVSASPITVTYGGGGSPEMWDVAVELAGVQPPNSAVMEDSGGGGIFGSSPFWLHPVFTFTRQSDQFQRVHDPGAPITTNISANWSSTAPPNTPLGTEDNEFYLSNVLINGTEMVIRLQNAEQTTVYPNDHCVNAIPILPGLTPFETLCADTDGPTNPAGFCFDAGETQTAHDLWYRYTAPATGNDVMLLISTCPTLGGNADYDTDLAMYDGTACQPDTMFLVECNDDAVMYPCGRDNFLSAMYVPVVLNQACLIRVGGFAPGDAGTGQLHLQEYEVADGFLSQRRNDVTGYLSDQDGGQTMAEDFRLSQAETIHRITIYGTYEGGDNQPIENFSVMFQSDSGGLPGGVLDFQGILPANTTHTDVTPPLSGVSSIWQVDLVLSPPVALGPGRFWVSVFNDTVGDADDFFWDTGSIDLPHAFHLGSIGSSGGVPTTIADDLAISLQGACAADTNGDFNVGIQDLLAVLAAWGPCDAPCPPHCAADVVADCQVGIQDLLFVLSEWGACE